ncbi:MAG TPA: hypothetical protein IAA07_04135 [Candidatus Lachnoclostridium stercoravium]|uniref:Uncharacterized protein n=1 Tax=Candidatus Lachnoclostridium stercoravium TaxID=2838633 RepID=A0A9D2HFR4_9FIRM|nr:hypothetical protein [Candidatus Lachnoclostridium stercoravium]
MTSQGKEQGNRIIRKSGMGSSVFMMEMIMVVFFFCLCAAVSSLLFARADSMSRLAADTNQAVLKAENLAEIFKSGGMDHYQDYPETAGGLAFDTGSYQFAWNEAWEPQAADGDGAGCPYYGEMVILRADEPGGFMETAVITITRSQDGKTLYELSVSSYHGM